MPRKENKYIKEVYEQILNAEYLGISSTNIAINLGLMAHNIKTSLINLKRKNTIYSKISLALKDDGNPDGRSMKYYATIYKKGMPLNTEQLSIINKIRIGRKITEVGK